jgi:phosphate-selective porin OprO/OprP
VTGLVYISDGGDQYLHVGGSGRYSGPEKGVIRLRGRPESNVAPNYVDTGDIPADHQTELALESVWTHGAYSLMSEYVRSWVDSPQTGNPTFYGFYATASWTITGEHRPYDRNVGYARRIIPERRGGAWELVARYSHLDLDDGPIRGGILDKGLLGFNWWASRQWRIGFDYGLGNLNRFDRNGLSHIFLTRFQWIF